MKTHKIVGVLLAGVAMMSIAGTALAYRGDYQAKGPNADPTREAAMTEAMTTKNYAAWKALMGDRGRVTQVVTEANFAKFAEAWRLGKAGDVSGADAIRAELGLRTSTEAGKGQGMGRGQGRGNGMHRMNCSGVTVPPSL